MHTAGAQREATRRRVAKPGEMTDIRERKRRSERAHKMRPATDTAKDGCWTEWVASDVWATGEVNSSPLSERPCPPTGIRTFPPPPSFLPPPPPAEKIDCSSTCSVTSDESTDCVSEPSERLDNAGSEAGDQALSIWVSVEMDFDSLVFELTPDDISDSPSSIRMRPSASADEVEPELQQLLEPATHGPGRTCGSTRLSSRAKAWTPGASLPGVPILCSQMLDILTAAQAAMACCGLATEGGILQRPSGWAITMYVHAANLVRKEEVINVGKTALIENSRRSRSIYVVGYCSQPFVITPMGFSTILCDVEDSSNACWHFIQNGFCRYSNECKRQHPKHQAIVNVMIKIKA